MSVTKLCNRLFSVNPIILNLLKQAENPRTARRLILAYLEEISRFLHSTTLRHKSLEWPLQINCLNNFREIISARSEKLAKYSIMHVLWLLAHEKYNDLPDDLSEAFFEDLAHIWMGMAGKSGVYDKYQTPRFLKMEGREAALERTKELDVIAATGKKYIDRYVGGLDDKVIKKRVKNRKNILRHYNADEADWNDYLWQIQHVIRTAEQLSALIDLTDEEREAIEKAKKSGLPFGITPYYVSLMDKEPHRKYDHAVRAQVIPPPYYVEKMTEHRGDRSYCFDFMGEQDTSPVDLVTRRYPNICILKPYNTCSQICVYCQRNWEIDDVLIPEALASKEKITEAVEWLREHPGINEVLLTGGDPLVMRDDRIRFVMEQVAGLQQVERIRIGSRTPVVLPQRITDDLADLLAEYHIPGKREVCIVTHFEHPYEVTPEALRAVQLFRKRGISLYNQAVFTMENSRRYELVALRRLLRLIGVDPYYSFNAKGKEETKNYRVPMARLQQEAKEEARLVPGVMRTDEPVYNVPRLGKNYIRAEQNHTLLTILPNGSRVYEFHPWEKNMYLVPTYIDVDVPIFEYLRELKKRGEDPEYYHTIWYYF